MNRRWLIVSLSAVTALATLAVRPSATSGQSLHLAELFAERGRIPDARAEVLAWFEIRGDEATPNEMQHGLWLRGRFAEDPAAGAADLKRLVEDYPEGPYTGLALGWMAAAAAEAGDEPRAAALYTRVAQGYPDSEIADPARDWLRARGITVAAPEAAGDTREVAPPMSSGDTREVAPPPDTTQRRAARPPAPADTVVADTLVVPAAAADTLAAPPPSPDTVASVVSDSAAAAEPEIDSVAPEAEITDSVPADSTVTRAAAPPETAAVPPETAPPETETPPPPAVEEPERIPPGPPIPGAATAGPFAVQIGAFRNPVGAGGLVDELITAGFEARLVQTPINDLLRVRIGRFATLEEAQAELERVRAGGYDGAVVNDARRETQVR